MDKICGTFRLVGLFQIGTDGCATSHHLFRKNVFLFLGYQKLLKFNHPQGKDVTFYKQHIFSFHEREI